MEHDVEENESSLSVDEFLASVGPQRTKLGSIKLSLPKITKSSKTPLQKNTNPQRGSHTAKTCNFSYSCKNNLEPINLNRPKFMSASKLTRSTSTPEMDSKFSSFSSMKNPLAYRRMHFSHDHSEKQSSNLSSQKENINVISGSSLHRSNVCDQKVRASSHDVTDLMKEFTVSENGTKSSSLKNLAGLNHHKDDTLAANNTMDDFRQPDFKRSQSLRVRTAEVPSASSVNEKKLDLPTKSKVSEHTSQANSPLSALKSKAQIIQIHDKSYLQCGKLGAGGSSVVYKAMDMENFQQRAIKIVSFDQNDPSLVESYQNEVKILKKLQYSSRVIKLHDHEETERDMKLVIEIGGPDLATLLLNSRRNKTNPMSEFTIKHYWQEMLLAVQVIHKEGVIHSDLKPANFLLVNGMLKLIDFGIASSIQQDMTSVFKDCQAGTWNYMSPESLNDIYSGPIINGKVQDKPIIKIGVKSDVWSLGCILYNMVYGKTPFQHLVKPLQKLAAISNPNTQIEFPLLSDVYLIDVLKRCLRFNQHERPSIEELLAHPYLASSKRSQPSHVDLSKADKVLHKPPLVKFS